MDVFTPVIVYVADKIAAQIIKDEVWTKKIKHWFWPPKKYNTELYKVIAKTIEEYESNHPYKGPWDKFPFYQSQILFEELSKYILFESFSSNGVSEKLAENPNIEIPTEEELRDFYILFTKKIQANKTLEKLFIEETYQKQIFTIVSVVNKMQHTLNDVKSNTSATKQMVTTLYESHQAKQIDAEIVIGALQRQVTRQLQKQVNSGKYLKDTFIETGGHKDHLRFVCDGLFYVQLFMEELAVLDFGLLNKHLSAKGLSPFEFVLSSFETRYPNLIHENAQEFFEELVDYLEKKKEEIEQSGISSNDRSTFTWKLTDAIAVTKQFLSKVVLITENAGQGKTNFLCDFVDNFLQKRYIPTVFLTGTDIRPDDIRGSLLAKVFPDRNDLSFDTMLQEVKKVCKTQRTYFVIVIDGMNENTNSKLFSRTLESFIEESLEHDFIRIALSCRTEYYENNFKNLEAASFKDQLSTLEALLNRHQERNGENKKLFDTYFTYFNVSYKWIAEKVRQQLSTNFLLLRIFCETYRNRKFDAIYNIYKEELFDNYFALKRHEINKRFLENDDFSVTGNFDIKNFINSVIEWMIQNKVYVNVPLDTLLGNQEHRDVYVRFIDENILIRKDIQLTPTGLFTDTEVVNFTFDEFRDFLISRYLVDTIYLHSHDEFTAFLNDQLVGKSPILEGCSTFLFFIARKMGDLKLQEIVGQQWWYPSVFSDCIFDVKDEDITPADKDYLKSYFLHGDAANAGMISDLISRFDTESFKNLNLDFLFDLLLGLDQPTYEKVFSDFFSTNQWSHNGIKQRNLLEQLEEILNKNLFEKHPKFHKAFELLLYMFDLDENWQIQDLYERYHFLYPQVSRSQITRALQTKNNSLLTELNQFAHIYETGV
jgi:hypothetical protein